MTRTVVVFETLVYSLFRPWRRC